jgi:hypothetical protein
MGGRCKLTAFDPFQSTEYAHDQSNLPRRTRRARASRRFRHGRFDPRLSIGVVDVERLHDRHHRQTAGVRAVRRNFDAAGRHGDGGSAVDLSAAEAGFAFALDRYLLSSSRCVQEVALTVEERRRTRRISLTLEFQNSTYFSYASVVVRNGTCRGHGIRRAWTVGTASRLALATRWWPSIRLYRPGAISASRTGRDKSAARTVALCLIALVERAGLKPPLDRQESGLRIESAGEHPPVSPEYRQQSVRLLQISPQAPPMTLLAAPLRLRCCHSMQVGGEWPWHFPEW